ncbi:hypothetical protein OG21DRAFT_1496847 [Imleria badia]|nr:hypothetical protein OG21DRAFT_1496847 [Imleria badia]
MRQSTIFTLLSAFFLAVLVARVDAESFEAQAGKIKIITPYHGSCGFEANNMVAVSPQSGYGCGDSITIRLTGVEESFHGTVADMCDSCALSQLNAAINIFNNHVKAALGEFLNGEWN